MKRLAALGLIVLAALVTTPVAALAFVYGNPGPSVLAVPHQGPSVLAVPRHHGEPSVLGVPRGHDRHRFHPGLGYIYRQPVWVQPQWAWNGWQWVWVPGYWAR